VQFLLAASLIRAPAANGAATAVRRITVAAALVAAVALAASIADRSALLASAGASQDSLERDLRPRIWGVAWTKFTEAPWLGYGFGREILAAEFIPHTPPVLNHPRILHGHNVFVDMALQLGVAGLAAFTALLALLVCEYRGYLGREEVAPLGVLGLLVLSGFVLKCLTDDFLHRHNALVFWALNAMLLGCARATLAREGEATPRAAAEPR
jgi:O-antigen ligase